MAGETISWTVEVINLGPSTAENVIVYDRLPPGITVTSVGGDATLAGCTTGAPGSAIDRLSCGLGTLAAGESAFFVIEADLDDDLPDGVRLENDACAFSDEYDDNNANNCASTITEIASVADLDIVKRVEPATIAAGETQTVVIDVTSDGPSVAMDVWVRDLLPYVGLFVTDWQILRGQSGTPAVYNPDGDASASLGQRELGKV